MDTRHLNFAAHRISRRESFLGSEPIVSAPVFVLATLLVNRETGRRARLAFGAAVQGLLSRHFIQG